MRIVSRGRTRRYTSARLPPLAFFSWPLPFGANPEIELLDKFPCQWRIRKQRDEGKRTVEKESRRRGDGEGGNFAEENEKAKQFKTVPGTGSCAGVHVDTRIIEMRFARMEVIQSVLQKKVYYNF